MSLAVSVDSNKRSDERGFTLLELIVVTALMGIMLSLSIPSMRDSFFTDPLKSAARNMMGLVSGVRAQAVRSRQPYLLHISQADNRIWCEMDQPEGSESQKEAEALESDIPATKDLVFPESVHVAGVWLENDEDPALDDMVAWISEKGYMTETIIQLEDDEGNHLNVQFYPFIGPAIVGDSAVP